jgi:hypothetical protein
MDNRGLVLTHLLGEPKYYDVKGASGKNNRHWFCGTCGSSLYTELEVLAGTVCIKAGTLDGGAASLDNDVKTEFYCSNRVSYLEGVKGAQQEPRFV